MKSNDMKERNPVNLERNPFNLERNPFNLYKFDERK